MFSELKDDVTLFCKIINPNFFPFLSKKKIIKRKKITTK